MTISALTAQEILRETRQALNLPPHPTDLIDQPMLAAIARRAAGIYCPCSRATLASALYDSLRYIAEDATIEECIEAAIEGLIIGGDLLELNHVTIDDPAAKGAWIFAAPFGFVVRPGGSVFIIGVSADDPTPLPPSLHARVKYQHYARIISPEPSEDLPLALRELELTELPERVWLKAPKQQSPRDFFDEMTRRLIAQAPSGHVEDLSLIDPEKPVNYYAGRRTSAKHKTGCFVARRPQAYGAPIWGFAQVQDGVLTKFLDFPLKGSRWRGCDIAWHLQMAIDSCRGMPQRYSRRRTSDTSSLDFFSPLPAWAERRLAIIGRPAERHGCLNSYHIPEPDMPTEEAFLQERLWLAPNDSAREGS